MPNARDIALIFLSLQALFMGLIPFLLLGALAYGCYRLRGLMREWLRIGLTYAELVRIKADELSRQIAEPFIRVHSAVRWLTTVLNKLLQGGRL